MLSVSPLGELYGFLACDSLVHFFACIFFVREAITFVAKPCAGSLEVYIRPVVGTEFPSKDNAWFKATRKKDANFIKLPLLYSEYLIY